MERVFEGLSMGSKMQTRYNVSYNNSINKLEQPNTKNMFQLQNCSTDVFILKTTPSGELQDLNTIVYITLPIKDCICLVQCQLMPGVIATSSRAGLS